MSKRREFAAVSTPQSSTMALLSFPSGDCTFALFGIAMPGSAMAAVWNSRQPAILVRSGGRCRRPSGRRWRGLRGAPGVDPCVDPYYAAKLAAGGHPGGFATGVRDAPATRERNRQWNAPTPLSAGHQCIRTHFCLKTAGTEAEKCAIGWSRVPVSRAGPLGVLSAIEATTSPIKNALVAQLDRASDFESEGREFESLRARQAKSST